MEPSKSPRKSNQVYRLPGNLGVNRGSHQAGLALPAVLAILAALIALAALVLQRNRSQVHPWIKARDALQAHYIAEAGLAHALYLEKYAEAPDTLARDSGSQSKDPGGSFGFSSSLASSVDTAAPLVFRTDTSLALPEVTVNRDGPYLEIQSKASHGAEAVEIKATFGRALDETAFGPALTWENETPVAAFQASQISGHLRLKTPTPGVAALAWPANFSVSGYAQTFASEHFSRAEAELNKALAKEGGQSGNGHFDSRHAPDFARYGGELSYARGQVDISGGLFDTLHIRGPGSLFSQGEIRVRGKVRLTDVTLASEKDIIFEGEVSGEGLRVYARRNLSLLGKCRIEMQGLAGGDIHLRDEAQTVGASLLMVMAGTNPKKGADSVQAIRIVQSASAQGFLLAVGQGSRVVMGGEANRVHGVILAEEAWLAGIIEGAVAVRTLRCAEGGPPQCLGPVRIFRSALNPRFLQPLALGPKDAENLNYQLLSYEATPVNASATEASGLEAWSGSTSFRNDLR